MEAKEFKKTMPILFLMCGLPCSGKTTLAKKLEQERSALRLTPDEWMDSIVGDGYDEEKRTVVESTMWQIAERCLTLGTNVILDFGFWSRSERDEFKARAEKIPAHVELHFLDVPTEELFQRINERNKMLPKHAFHIKEDEFKLWLSIFERPGRDEFLE